MKYILFSLLILQQYVGIAQFVPHQRIKPTELWNKLNTYNTLQDASGVYPQFLPEKKDITDSMKWKIISILKREWPDSVIKYKVDVAFSTYKEHFNGLLWDKKLIDTIFKVARESHGYFDSALHYVYDSMGLDFKKKFEKQLREAPIPTEIVLTAAVLKIKEAIPIIKSDLAATTHYIDTTAAELALAGLGDENLQKKYYKNRFPDYGFNDFINLAYVIGNQESVSKLASYFDTTKFNYYSTEDGPDTSHKVFLAEEIVTVIFGLIKNKDFINGYLKQPLFKDKNGETPSFILNTIIGSFQSKEQINYVKEWLIANKGKYELDN
jgi:hypothetical protein